MLSRVLGLAAAAWLSAAVSAEATTFTFSVTAQELSIDTSVYAPVNFSFEQTWRATLPAPHSSTFMDPDTGLTTSTVRVVGTAQADPSPLADTIKSYIALPATPPELFFSAIERVTTPLGGVPSATYSFIVEEYTHLEIPLGDGTFNDLTYLTTVNGDGAFPLRDISALDDASIARMLQQVGPLTWHEWGIQAVHDPVSGAYDHYHSLVYNGVATLTGFGAPEPDAWAMMLLGFGALGAALRRKRKAVDAASALPCDLNRVRRVGDR